RREEAGEIPAGGRHRQHFDRRVRIGAAYAWCAERKWPDEVCFERGKHSLANVGWLHRSSPGKRPKPSSACTPVVAPSSLRSFFAAPLAAEVFLPLEGLAAPTRFSSSARSPLSAKRRSITASWNCLSARCSSGVLGQNGGTASSVQP